MSALLCTLGFVTVTEWCAASVCCSIWYKYSPRRHSSARWNDRPFAELFVLAAMIRWLNLKENDHNLFSHHCLPGVEEPAHKSDIWLEVVLSYRIWSQVRYHQRHNVMRYRLISYTPSQLRRAFVEIFIDDHQNDPLPCSFPCTLACEKQKKLATVWNEGFSFSPRQERQRGRAPTRTHRTSDRKSLESVAAR